MNTFIKYKQSDEQIGYGELGTSAILNHTLSDASTLAPLFDGVMAVETEYHRRILLSDHKFMGDMTEKHGHTGAQMFSQSHPTLGGAWASPIESGVYWLCGGPSTFLPYATSGQTTSNAYLMKIDSKGNVLQQLPARSTAHPWPTVVHETTTHLWTMSQSNSAAGSTSDIQYVRKSDGYVQFNGPTNGSGAYTVPKLLGVLAGSIWYAKHSQTNTQIIRINTDTGGTPTYTIVASHNHSYTNAIGKTDNTAIIHDAANTTWSFHTAEQRSTTSIGLKYWTVNYGTNAVTNEALTVTDPSGFAGTIGSRLFIGATSSRHCALMPFYVGSDYIVVCEEHGVSSVAYGNIRVFKKDNASVNSPVTAVSRTDMEEQYNRGFHPLSDDNTVMLSSGFTDSRIWNFNAVSESFELVESIPQVREVGRDSQGRRWIYDVTSSISLVSIALPSQITITPALTSYTYDGSDINTTVAVGSYNVGGALIASNVTLTISGDGMTFADTTKTFVMTTSASSTTDVPVVITGGGLTRILAAITIA